MAGVMHSPLGSKISTVTQLSSSSNMPEASLVSTHPRKHGDAEKWPFSSFEDKETVGKN
jgi:hypothetical protein